MTIIEENEHEFVQAVAKLTYSNPFSTERIALEQKALGPEFDTESHPFWSLAVEAKDDVRSNVTKLINKIERTADTIRDRLTKGEKATHKELCLYDDLAIHVLYYKFFYDWWEVEARNEVGSNSNSQTWRQFEKEFDRWLAIGNHAFPSRDSKAHIYACLHQVCRAFFHIYNCVVGRSWPAARLRSRIWQSIFTHDMRRYRRSLYRHLPKVTTLISGPSGTGKELVARAVGRSRYIPFDEKSERFLASANESFLALNLTAFSPMLIESELFGHQKGSFTGATAAREGWLETCGPWGAVFLDEIGELDRSIQVKLLRLLQNRTFHRIGESQTREFHGKLITATNRNLMAEIQKGAFREDLYYRLCSDVIVTPTLQEQIAENPSDLEHLIAFICQNIDEEESDSLKDQVAAWIKNSLPSDYAWPGNIRELEQCVRNIMIHGQYTPDAGSDSTWEESRELAAEIQEVSITMDELEQRYCKLAYKKTSSYEKAARLLGIDRRTVRSKIFMD